MLDIFSYGFMIRAFIAGSIISVIAPLTGTFLVLRRLSQIGDTLSHIALAGVAAGLLLGLNPTISSIIILILSSLGIEKLRKIYLRYSEISLAIMMSAGMAVAVILLSLSIGSSANIMNYLFGSISSVSITDIYLIVILGIAVVLVIVSFYKELLFISFDEEAAKVSGIPVNQINLFFTILVALTIALSIRIIGALLVSALMVIPAASSLKIAKSFKQTIAYSIIFSFISVFVGIFASFYLNLSPGGSIVIVSLIIFVISNILKKYT
ncbi:metal ABC transporter permease [Aceticella autotrophica]|uniref:Metal ABC transporter permease n=1 Tax=Aceticella autotrophica TaxID=2755338 RepID=A0A975AX03_9THEO|nr:metal ABC transporter permease [Aceticella autotrophica]QSZ28042.1 metal ABC transporter permease [Aceticella autotrophica]